MATSDAETFYGFRHFDWLSYAGSNAGVTIDLDSEYSPGRGSGGWAAGDELNDINNLIGSNFADTLTSNDNDNILEGRGGADTYKFDAFDGGSDRIIASNDGTGNKLVFHAAFDETYTDANFAFTKIGDDLQIVVSAGGYTNNTVVIEDYFDQADNAYTIYSKTYGSSSDGSIVSTQPAETS